MSWEWPKEPYKGLAYYGPQDELLFAGRDRDIQTCLTHLAKPKARILLLHGHTGCGKSSFLRAGLIPTMERQGHGFLFMRDHKDRPEFIRTTTAPLPKIAQSFFHFISRRHVVQTADGAKVVTLEDLRGDHKDLGSFTDFHSEPRQLIELVSAIAKRFHGYKLVFVLDQGEEVFASGTTKASRAFFNFLKLFTAREIRAQLIIALRTDKFGEFFGQMHFDESVISDVKQYLLSDLGPDGVKKAILLPTSDSQIKGHPTPPREIYFFTYEGERTPAEEGDGTRTSLADHIVKELFDADRSGGILPAMQIVCRDLYNALPKIVPAVEGDMPAPSQVRVITSKMYEAGGGVTGPIDRHITRSLRDAIAVAEPDADLDIEERKWRRALARLAKPAPGGGVSADPKDEFGLMAILSAEGLGPGVERQLDYLLQPDILILRRYTSLHARASGLTTSYSLGHDILGLTLFRWVLQEEEKERWRQHELAAQLAAQREQAKKRKLWWIGGSLAASFAGVLAAGAWLTIDASDTKKSTEYRALLRDARSPETDPLSAIIPALNAVAVQSSVILPSNQDKESSKDALAEILSRAPYVVRQPHSEPEVSSTLITPLSKTIFFWGMDQTIRTFDLAGVAKETYELADHLPARFRDAKLDWVSEPTPGTFGLVLRIDEGQGGTAVVFVRAGTVLQIYQTDDLFASFGDLRASYSIDMTQTITADGNSVYALFKGSSRGYAREQGIFKVDAFRLDPNARLTPTASLSQSWTGHREEPRWATMASGAILLRGFQELDEPAVKSGDKMILRHIRAYDLRSQGSPLLWSLDKNPDLKRCVDQAKELICKFQVYDLGPSNYLMAYVPEIEKDTLAATSDQRTPFFGFIEAMTGKTFVVPIDRSTSQFLGPVATTSDYYTDPLDRFVLGGPYGESLVGKKSGLMLSLVKVQNGSLVRWGTYRSQLGAQFVILPDGQTLVSISDANIRVWDISRSQDDLRGEYSQLPLGQLIQAACARNGMDHTLCKESVVAKRTMTP